MVEICDEWEPKLTAAQFLRGAPFKTIHLIIEVGSAMSERPRFRQIDRRNEELPATFEVPMNDLRFSTPEAVKEVIARATRVTLREVAATWRLPTLPDLDD